MLRLSVCLNAGPRKGQAQAAILVKTPDTESVLAAAANKLRLKKKEVALARLFVWRTGHELPRNEAVSAEHVRNDDLIAISLGEPYAGPQKPESEQQPQPGTPATESSSSALSPAPVIPAPAIAGRDDCGRRFSGLAELWSEKR